MEMDSHVKELQIYWIMIKNDGEEKCLFLEIYYIVCEEKYLQIV